MAGYVKAVSLTGVPIIFAEPSRGVEPRREPYGGSPLPERLASDGNRCVFRALVYSPAFMHPLIWDAYGWDSNPYLRLSRRCGCHYRHLTEKC